MLKKYIILSSRHEDTKSTRVCRKLPTWGPSVGCLGLETQCKTNESGPRTHWTYSLARHGSLLFSPSLSLPCPSTAALLLSPDLTIHQDS